MDKEIDDAVKTLIQAQRKMLKYEDRRERMRVTGYFDEDSGSEREKDWDEYAITYRELLQKREREYNQVMLRVAGIQAQVGRERSLVTQRPEHVADNPRETIVRRIANVVEDFVARSLYTSAFVRDFCTDVTKRVRIEELLGEVLDEYKRQREIFVSEMHRCAQMVGGETEVVDLQKCYVLLRNVYMRFFAGAREVYEKAAIVCGDGLNEEALAIIDPYEQVYSALTSVCHDGRVVPRTMWIWYHARENSGWINKRVYCTALITRVYSVDGTQLALDAVRVGQALLNSFIVAFAFADFIVVAQRLDGRLISELDVVDNTSILERAWNVSQTLVNVLGITDEATLTTVHAAGYVRGYIGETIIDVMGSHEDTQGEAIMTSLHDYFPTSQERVSQTTTQRISSVAETARDAGMPLDTQSSIRSNRRFIWQTRVLSYEYPPGSNNPRSINVVPSGKREDQLLSCEKFYIFLTPSSNN